MQRLEVSGAVRPIYGSLGVKRLKLGEIYGSRNLNTCIENLLNIRVKQRHLRN